MEDGFSLDALAGAQVNTALGMPEDEVGASSDLALITVQGLEIKAAI